ncbi:F0F1 ATP synthase subunit A [Alkaliphilus oremlandii]|uniref:ATP synthase subunit a n=1 Tax=Alkaliphilus oremlandii (strain OhILAs) TaxID=350688 RepID=A8MJW5_ALKOO|nr:F0F1 ATP synthase subunit A [Alkaliphilus oremlandii]ABW20097.1 ATP synthase F0, A subunit [Alkaliphilus oremlandii OhILAs]
MEGFGPKIIFEVGGIIISETVVVTWIIMAIFAITSILITRNFEKIPKGMQNVVEMLVDTMNKFTMQTMGEKRRSFAPYMGTIFLFLLVGNLIGLVGLRPPTADLNTTFALSILTFIIIHYNSVKTSGIGGKIKGYFEPLPFLFPINVLGDVATPISLAFRLFGNVVGGLVIMSLLYSALGSLSGMIGLQSIPIFQAGIPLVFHAYFDVFSGVLQSFIFVMLSMVYISNAMD